MATIANVTKGLEIFARHRGADEHIAGATHDIIYGVDVPADELTEEEREQLEETGWFWHDTVDCWAHFC